jgi:hypothetical protein
MGRAGRGVTAGTFAPAVNRAAMVQATVCRAFMIVSATTCG